METHRSTGQVARLLHVTEPQLAEAVRRGKIIPAPDVFAGRRLWTAEHARQAATHLAVLSDAVERDIAAAFAESAQAVAP